MAQSGWVSWGCETIDSDAWYFSRRAGSTVGQSRVISSETCGVIKLNDMADACKEAKKVEQFGS
jgi:hypothetical protein